MQLMIGKNVMEKIFGAARSAGNNECMGLLASPRDSVMVTEMRLLPAAATATHAEASPMALRVCAEELVKNGLIPRGIWHSHGRMEVFHSGTDQGTMERLLPAMAGWHFKRPSHVVLSPAVTAPDEALLPLKDGRVIVFEIVGPSLPGGCGNELGGWGGVATNFTGKSGAEPTAGFDGTKLRMESNGVRVELEVPEGAIVHSRVEDRAPYRYSTLYSLVVNTRRELFAECLEVKDFGGQSQTWVNACEVITAGMGPDELCEAKGRPSFFGSVVVPVGGR